MNKLKINPIPLTVGASRLLRSERFFRLYLNAAARAGLVGEEKNALVLFLVGISRLLSHQHDGGGFWSLAKNGLSGALI